MAKQVQTGGAFGEKNAVIAGLAHHGLWIVLILEHTESRRQFGHDQTGAEVLGGRKGVGEVEIGGFGGEFIVFFGGCCSVIDVAIVIVIIIVAVIVVVAVVLSRRNGADDGGGGRLVGLDNIVLGFFLFMPAKAIHDGE